MSEQGHDLEGNANANQSVPDGPVEKACRLISELAILVMLGVVGLDIITRSVFGFSYQISEEVAGYMLVAVTFFSLAVCQARGSFHRVQLLDSWLPPRPRMISWIIFDMVSLALVALLAWQLGRFELASWRSGFSAPTLLATPLWLPQLAMVVGTILFGAAIVRTIMINLQRLRALDQES